MPSIDTSTVGGALGVAFFCIGLYAYVVLGWRFGDGESTTLGTALGLAAVVVALALTAVRR